MREEMTGKTVVVTGGSSGIGREVARRARMAGAEVVIIGRDSKRLEEAASQLSVRGLRADVGVESEVRTAFDQIEGVDHVFSAAGSTRLGPLPDAPVDEQLAALKERIWGNAYVLQVSLPKMREGGSHVFTGGISTDRPVPGAWVSGVATAAAEQMARVFAVELAPLRFNAVSPGWTDTPMWDRVLGTSKAATLEQVGGGLPVGRVATAGEVAEAVLFLMNNPAVTGEVLHVDGGGRLV